jgi:very-short-patch-repair endonuclease
MQIAPISKKFTCECGKIFSSSQSFNGHKCHCKEHLIAKGGIARYEAYLEQQAKSSKLAIETKQAQAAAERTASFTAWLDSKPCCERCGNIMTAKYGSGRFCSEACAKSRNQSEETRQKIRESLSKTLTDKQKPELRPKKFCCICGRKIKSYNKTGYCKKCLDGTDEGSLVKQSLGKKGYATMQANGTHHSWQSRNITSYAEQYWINVLDAYNITYDREFPIKHGNSNYFLDFRLEHNGKLIDLEIDGKQHQYEDRAKLDVVRDEFMQSIGYIVYRILWNNVNKPEGRKLMQDKINAFLEFYNSL